MSNRLHTFTGTGFDPLHPRTEDVRLDDIAQALSNTCRFNGHTPRFYSVAQHAVLVAEIVLSVSNDPRWALLALHHDSAEAYLMDVPRPIKGGILFRQPVRLTDEPESPTGYLATPYDLAELRIWRTIIDALWIADIEEAHQLVKDADDALLDCELRSFFGAGSRDGEEGKFPLIKCPPIPLSECQAPTMAKASFLAMHEHLVRECAP